MSGNDVIPATTHTHVSAQIVDLETAISNNVDVAANTLYRLNGVLNNFSAIVVPTMTNDSSQGYSIGSIWVVSSLGQSFICTSATNGAAVWKDITESSGGAISQVFSGADRAGNRNLNNGFIGIPMDYFFWIDTQYFEMTLGSNELKYIGPGSVLARVHYDITTDLTNNSRSNAVARIMLNTGPGFVEVAAPRAYNYNRDSNVGRNTASATVHLVLSTNNRLRIEAARFSGFGNCFTEPESCRFSVETIKFT